MPCSSCSWVALLASRSEQPACQAAERLRRAISRELGAAVYSPKRPGVQVRPCPGGPTMAGRTVASKVH
jgi:hypothetical protein